MRRYPMFDISVVIGHAGGIVTLAPGRETGRRSGSGRADRTKRGRPRPAPRSRPGGYRHQPLGRRRRDRRGARGWDWGGVVGGDLCVPGCDDPGAPGLDLAIESEGLDDADVHVDGAIGGGEFDRADEQVSSITTAKSNNKIQNRNKMEKPNKQCHYAF